MIRVGVIGYGYWGPNIVRNLHGLDNTQVAMVCDHSTQALGKLRKSFPGVASCTDANEVLTSPNIDAVCVITPVWTHFELAKKALENGKNVFVEKPFTSNSRQAEELIDLAARGSAVLVISQDLDELAEIADRIAVMFHGRLSAPLEAAEATRERLGLLMGGVSTGSSASGAEAEAKHAVGA